MKRKATRTRRSEVKSQGELPERDPNLIAVIGRGVVPPVLYDPKRRKDLGLPEDDDAWPVHDRVKHPVSRGTRRGRQGFRQIV